MKKIKIWNEGEYNYPLAFDFRPNLRAYLIDDDKTRPCMIILPGGGYAIVVPPEGELVAKRFNELGYNCFVMTYTTNQTMRAPVMEQAMRDLARAIRFVRKNADEYRIDKNKLCICGFSAAGHVCASVCDYWEEIEDANPDYKDISCRPDAAILSYPVITSGEYAHKDSFRFLLGADIYDRTDDEAKALLNRYSLEKNVKANNPPCFIWQTETDDIVPVQNSYLYAEALKEKGIKVGCITNKVEPIAKNIINHFFGGMDVVYGQVDGVPNKPDPLLTLKALDELGLDPKECLFVGDTSVDIETALNSGAVSLGVLWGFRTEDELRGAGADYIVSDAKEILEIIDTHE